MSDGTEWAPPRPSRSEAAASVSDPARASGDGLPRERTRPSSPGGSLGERRRSPARRVLVASLALLAAIGLVAGAGAVLQPVYGSESPFAGTPFVDVRSAPQARGWSLPLAEEFAPGLPTDCVSVRAGAVDARHELLTASLPPAGSTLQDARCEVSSPATPGRLVMVDPATGRIAWRRSLARDLDTQVFSLVWHASPAGVVVVGVDGSRGDWLLALSTATGRTLGVARVASPDDAINFAVSRGLVVSVAPDVGGAVNTFTLRRIDALAEPLWTRKISAVLLPQLLPDRLVVPLPDGTRSVDGRTGRESPWGRNLRDLTGVRVSGERVVAQTIPRGVGLQASVVYLDRDGKTLWTWPAPAISSLAVSRRCVVVSTASARVTCLDPASGRARWSTTLSGSVLGTPAGSTTGDVAAIGPVRARDTSLLVTELDGDTGRVRFAASLPRGTEIVGQATATGYALGSGASSRGSTLVAFDLDSGRTLWTLRRGDLGVWGGHLVEITADGVARELRDGRRAPGRGMLDG